MAIYPIIPGQKHSEWDLPSPTAHSHSQPDATKEASQNATADLIDFGQSDGPAPAVRQDSKDIAAMLQSTGQKPDGPLIDFAGDLKKNLPATPKTPGPNRVRGDTGESNDAFFDAQT